MAELFRIACASVIFGGGLYLALRSIGILLRVFLLSDIKFPITLRNRLPRGWERYAIKKHRRSLGKTVGFFKDFFCCIFCGICLIVFLFWKADGIPRLFIFFSVGLGAFGVRKMLNKIAMPLEEWFIALTAFLLLWGIVPLCRVFSFLSLYLIAFLEKIAFFFIKSGKRFYTICTAKKYVAKAEKNLRDKKISVSVRAAVFEREEM